MSSPTAPTRLPSARSPKTPVDRGAAAKKVAEQDAKIEALQEQLAAAMELLNEQAEKPKRGRPAKVDDDMEEAA